MHKLSLIGAVCTFVFSVSAMEAVEDVFTFPPADYILKLFEKENSYDDFKDAFYFKLNYFELNSEDNIRRNHTLEDNVRIHRTYVYNFTYKDVCFKAKTTVTNIKEISFEMVYFVNNRNLCAEYSIGNGYFINVFTQLSENTICTINEEYLCKAEKPSFYSFYKAENPEDIKISVKHI